MRQMIPNFGNRRSRVVDEEQGALQNRKTHLDILFACSSEESFSGFDRPVVGQWGLQVVSRQPGTQESSLRVKVKGLYLTLFFDERKRRV